MSLTKTLLQKSLARWHSFPEFCPPLVRNLEKEMILQRINELDAEEVFQLLTHNYPEPGIIEEK